MGMFDDLIPQQQSGANAPAASASRGGYDDLIPQKRAVERGTILPFTKYEDGTWDNFDWKNSGITGTIYNAVTAPGDALRGNMPMTTRDPATGEARTSERAVQRGFDLAGIVSPVNPAVQAGDIALGTRPAKVPIPTAEQLRAAATQGFEQARGMKVDYSSKAVRDLAVGVRNQLEQDGVLGELAPKTFSVLSKLEAAPEGSVAPFQGVVAARRAFGHAAKDFSNPTEQLAAKRVLEQLDRLLENPDPENVVAGPAAAAGKLQAEANSNWAAAKRSDYLTGIAERADLRAKAANSGRNLDNTVRQRVADVLIDPKRSAGFSDAEKAALEEIIRGTRTRNAAREVGNLLGGGGGLGALVTGSAGAAGAGAVVGGPVGAAIGGAIPPLVGVLSKTAANRMATKALSKAEEATRARSALYGLLRANAGVEPAPIGRKAVMVRGLLARDEDRD